MIPKILHIFGKYKPEKHFSGWLTNRWYAASINEEFMHGLKLINETGGFYISSETKTVAPLDSVLGLPFYNDGVSIIGTESHGVKVKTIVDGFKRWNWKTGKREEFLT